MQSLMGRGCVRNLRPHRCLPRGNPQDRAASLKPGEGMSEILAT
ncbi:hypothetical protein [Moorena producens]|nr:hypothetical protein [Moorena producens]